MRSPRKIQSGVTNRVSGVDNITPSVRVPPSDEEQIKVQHEANKPKEPAHRPSPDSPFAPVNSRSPSVRGAPIGKARVSTDAKDRATQQLPQLSGHTEYVLQVIRDFFSSRTPQALLDVFRDQDVTRSGSLGFDEFRAALRQVNVGLTEKDTAALFQISDLDGSGILPFAEWFNNFRKDGYSKPIESLRQPFFWSKTRPREPMERGDRVKLAARVMGTPSTSRSKEELMGVLRGELDPGAVMEAFRANDENHTGRLTIPQFVRAMKHLQLEVSEAQAEDVIASINQEHGSSMRQYLGHDAFRNTFHPSNGVTGATAFKHGASPQVRDRRQPTPIQSSEQKGGGKPKQTSATTQPLELDTSLMQSGTYVGMMAGATPRHEALEQTAPAPRRNSPGWPPRSIHEQPNTAREDMMSSWRGADVSHGQAGQFSNVGLIKPGRDIDWYEFLHQGPKTVFGPARTQALNAQPILTSAGYVQNNTAGFSPSSVFADPNAEPNYAAAASAAAAVARRGTLRGGSEHSPHMADLRRSGNRLRETERGSVSARDPHPSRASLRDVEENRWSRSVSECLVPAVESPSYAREAERLIPTSVRPPAEAETDKILAGARRKAKEQHMQQRVREMSVSHSVSQIKSSSLMIQSECSWSVTCSLRRSASSAGKHAQMK